jgi:hypothetical protein
VKITIGHTEDHGGILWEEYALDEDGKPLVFESVRDGVNFLADRNWGIEDLRTLDWHVEEDAE